MQRVKTILGLLVITGLFAVVVPVHQDMRALTKTYPGDYQAYYIPSSGYMKVMSLGYRNFWADLLYLWTLQYYDYYNMKVRYTYLHHTFEVITDLDPKFREAYIMGALFAFINKDWKLLYQMEDKGIESNPKDYIIPYDAGCYALFSEKNYTRAIHYFRIALRRNPDQPLLKDLLANAYRYRGDLKTSLNYWQEMYTQYKGQDNYRANYYKMAAARHIWKIRNEMNEQKINAALEAYHKKYGRNPHTLADLVGSGFLDAVPQDPAGNPYSYDSWTGKVTCTSQFNIKAAFGQW